MREIGGWGKAEGRTEVPESERDSRETWDWNWDYGLCTGEEYYIRWSELPPDAEFSVADLELPTRACVCCGLPYQSYGDLCPTCRNARH